MISSKKVIRDIIAIVLIAVAGVWVYKSYVAPRAEQNNHKADSHSEEQGNMEGDGSRFELDNHEDALSIDGKVYSMSDVDNKAQHFVAMMGGNPGALTKDVLARARSEAVRTLHVEAAMTKGAKELGIEISEEDVNEAIAKIVEEQGGEENYKKFLSQFNVSEEAMERRMRKDLLQTTIIDSLVEKNYLQDASEEVKNETYEKWLVEVSKDIQIKILGDSLKESLAAPASYTFQSPSEFPQGSPERTLAEYALAWKDQNWQKMINFSQKTWVSNESDPVGSLEAWYAFKTLKGFEITKTDKISDVITDITFKVYYEMITNQIDKKEITARVIKESAPMTTSVQGQWGVNPTSTLGEKDIN